MPLDDTKPGDSRNALFLAQACNLAYFDVPGGVDRFRDDLGLEARLISVGNTQVYVAGKNDKVLVVAFRGSQAKTRWTGSRTGYSPTPTTTLILPEGQIGTDFAAAGVGARFHRGFIEALHETWEPLLATVAEAMESNPPSALGHRAQPGRCPAPPGGLASSAQLHHGARGCHLRAPMIGNEAAARAFEQEFAGKILRYVNFEDPVPLLPSNQPGRQYVCSLPERGLAGRRGGCGVASICSRRSAGSAVDRLIEASQIDHLWRVVQSRISAHFIDHYQERVKLKCGDGESSAIAAETTITAQTDAKGELLEVKPNGLRSDRS